MRGEDSTSADQHHSNSVDCTIPGFSLCVTSKGSTRGPSDRTMTYPWIPLNDESIQKIDHKETGWPRALVFGLLR